ncbi:MAG: L-glutamate gamma-semialdehyde dehydrogenase, partial [Trueperaceae bacterium]|nr:L-glutamate gamma-semialdehyde dehydrogenase [Trueperaceae bacterium]
DFGVAAHRDAYRAALAEVEGRLGRTWPLVLGGERIKTATTIASVDPCRPDRVVGHAAAAGASEVDRAYAAAEAAFPVWSGWSAAERARALYRLAAVMRRRKLELCAWETFEAGKNFREADADVAEAMDFVEYYARSALRLEEPLVTHPWPGEQNVTTLEPIGVGLVIPPWNFLLAILVGSSMGPVAAGNTVVLKPSPQTPVIAGVFMECIDEAGWPAGVVNLITGADADIGDRLVDDPRARFINFTGSVATGLRIHQRAAAVQPGQRHLKKTFMELGGKDAMIVDETADLDVAVTAAVQGGFGFNGQKCSAMSRLILVDEVHDEVLERFVAAAGRLRVGRAVDDADVTAVISERQFDKVVGYARLGAEEGRVVLGGGPAADRPDGGWYVAPTIVADVAPHARLAQEEVFGPVVAVIRARDFDHALRIANDTDFGLTGGLVSRSRARLEQARREFKVGNLYFNRKITGALVGVQPFGGFKLSGTNSKGGGPDYLRLFVEARTVTERF